MPAGTVCLVGQAVDVHPTVVYVTVMAHYASTGAGTVAVALALWKIVAGGVRKFTPFAAAAAADERAVP